MVPSRVSPKLFRWLGKEIETWQSEGLITPEQAERLLSRYAPGSEFPAIRSTLITMIFSAFAGVLVAIGIVLFVSFYWKQLSPPAQMGILLCGLIGLNVLGIIVHRSKTEWRLLGDAILLMAAILFGASIFLVPQIVGNTFRAADGMFLWAAGTLLLVLVLDQPFFYAGLSFLVVGSLATCSLEEAYRLDRPLFEILAPMIVCPALLWAYAGRSVLSCLATGIAFCVWLVSLIDLDGFNDPGIRISTYVVAVGAAVWVLSEWSQLAPPMSSVFRFLGAVTTVQGFIILSFKEMYYETWQGRIKNHPEDPWFPGSFLELIPVFVLVATVIADLVFPRTREDSPAKAKRLRLFLVPFVAFGIAVLIFVLSHTQLALEESFVAAGAILGNVGAVFVASSLVVLGVMHNQSERLFVGLGTFLLWLWMRWIDVFGTNLLTGAALFILSGVVFWIVVVLWLRFKRVLSASAVPLRSDPEIPRFLIVAHEWVQKRQMFLLGLCAFVECLLLVFLYITA